MTFTRSQERTKIKIVFTEASYQDFSGLNHATEYQHEHSLLEDEI